MNQQHHDEQMEAHRRDFQTYWYPVRKNLKAEGYTDKALAIIEMKEWRAWLISRLTMAKV